MNHQNEVFEQQMFFFVFRSTPPSRPNNIRGGKFPSVGTDRQHTANRFKNGRPKTKLSCLGRTQKGNERKGRVFI